MDKVADKALGLLEQLAQKLGTTVERLWPILVAQMRAEGQVYLAVSLILGVALSAVAIYLNRLRAKLLAERVAKKDDLMEPPEILALMIGAAAAVAAVLVLTLGVAKNALMITNPDYYALEKVLDLVKGK